MHHLTDDDIAGVLYRAARAGGRRDGVRMSTDGDGEGKVRFSLFDNTQKREKIMSALRKIAAGAEEETVINLRDDLEQYGGTNHITFY